jgi:hypothetical protein
MQDPELSDAAAIEDGSNGDIGFWYTKAMGENWLFNSASMVEYYQRAARRGKGKILGVLDG